MNGKEVVEAELRGIRGKEGFHCHVVVVVVVLGISKTLSWTREYTLRRGKGERVSIATWWWWELQHRDLEVQVKGRTGQRGFPLPLWVVVVVVGDCNI